MAIGDVPNRNDKFLSNPIWLVCVWGVGAITRSGEFVKYGRCVRASAGIDETNWGLNCLYRYMGSVCVCVCGLGSYRECLSG